MAGPWLWAVVSLAAALAVLALAAWLLVRTADAPARALARRIGRLPWRRKARLALALLRDRRVPLWVKAVVPALVFYLVMPLDIIPDFIPVVGHLDDLLVVVLAGSTLIRGTPRAVLEDHLARLEQDLVRTDL